VPSPKSFILNIKWPISFVHAIIESKQMLNISKEYFLLGQKYIAIDFLWITISKLSNAIVQKNAAWNTGPWLQSFLHTFCHVTVSHQHTSLQFKVEQKIQGQPWRLCFNYNFILNQTIKIYCRTLTSPFEYTLNCIFYKSWVIFFLSSLNVD